MADTSLEIVATTQQDKKLTTTVSYVNASASAGDLKQFGQMLNALTDNTYEESIRVQKIHVDTEDVPEPAPPAKTVPTLTLEKNATKQGYIRYTYNGDGILAATAKDSWGDEGYVGKSESVSSNFVVLNSSDKNAATEVEITVVAAEGAEYAATTASGRFTWT